MSRRSVIGAVAGVVVFNGVANSALAPREPSLSPSQPNSAMTHDTKRKRSNHIRIALAAFAPLTNLLKFEWLALRPRRRRNDHLTKAASLC